MLLRNKGQWSLNQSLPMSSKRKSPVSRKTRKPQNNLQLSSDFTEFQASLSPRMSEEPAVEKPTRTNPLGVSRGSNTTQWSCNRLEVGDTKVERLMHILNFRVQIDGIHRHFSPCLMPSLTTAERLQTYGWNRYRYQLYNSICNILRHILRTHVLQVLAFSAISVLYPS